MSTQHPMSRHARKKLELTELQWNQVIPHVLESASLEGGVAVPVYGAFARVAKRFGVSPMTVSRVWRRAVQNRHDPAIGAYSAAPRKKGKCGRKASLQDTEELAKAISTIPPSQRRTVRALSGQLGIPKSTLHRTIQKGDILGARR